MKKIVAIFFLLMLLTQIVWAQPLAGDFRTRQSGNWSDANTWERYDGSNWVTAMNAPEATGTYAIEVQSGHTITLSTTADTTEATVGITINGTVRNTAVTVKPFKATITVNGTYEHAINGGALPIATWNDGSLCSVTGVTTNAGSAALNYSQNFHDFIWNCPLQSTNVTLYWNNITITGDVKILAAGSSSQQLRFTVNTLSNGNFTIDGNLECSVAGKIYIVLSVTNTFSPTATVKGSVILSGTGKLYGSAGTGTFTNGIATWAFAGDVSITNASSGLSNDGKSGTNIYRFQKAGTQTLNSIGTIAATDSTKPVTVEIASGTTLNMGTSQISGTQTITKVDSSATLISAHSNGLSGNLNGGINYLSANANYVFNGSGAQITGVCLPAIVNNLTVNNASGVTLSNNITINGTLTLINGKLALGSKHIVATLVSGGSQSSYIVTDSLGALTLNSVTNNNVCFPVGTLSSYNPVIINNTGTADNFSVRVQPTLDYTQIDTQKVVHRQWVITEATPGGSNATLSFQWNNNEEAASFSRNSTVFVTRYNGSTWVQKAAVVGGSNPYTATASCFTNFSPFILSSDSLCQSVGDTITAAWKVQLTANAGSVVDNDNHLGIAQNATDGFDATLDTPKPPEPPGSYVQIYFPHPEYNQPLGDNYAQDIRAKRVLADSVIRWNFDVKTNQSNTDVTLHFISDGNIPSGFGIVLKDLTLGTRKNLKKYGMSYTYNSGTEEIHQFEIMIGDSTGPTVSVLQPNGGEILRANHPYNISWIANDVNGIDSVYLYSSTNSGATYEYIASLSGSNLNYVWSVPPAYLNHNGSIKVVTSDSMGNTNSDASNHTFTLVGDSLATTFATGWNLMGTSLKAADSTVSDIFADDISESFYIYGYELSTGYVQPTWIKHSNGYWLGLLHSFSVDVVGAPVTDQYTVSLTPGFNIISNPLVVSVPKDSLKFSKDGAVVFYAQALSNGWIATGIQGYNRTFNNYETVDSLQIWSGYWLGVIQAGVEMIVTPSGSNQVPVQSPKISTPKEGSQISLPLSKISKTQSDDWIVNISASTAKGADHSLKFGVKADATDGFDARYDEPKAPASPSGQTVELYFSHPDWVPILGSKFNCDICFPHSKNTWTFYVVSAKNTAVTLSWDANLAPTTLVMIDNGSGTEIDVNNVKSYTFTNEGTRTFTINAKTTAVNNNETTPTSFNLQQNYPNPFNPTTSISFSLPTRSFVSLKVFDLIGREIATIISEELSAGNYSRKWNATGMPSGVYFYRLQSGLFTETKKLILLR